nr:MFS transporter [Priestia megaterium]
MKDLLVSVATRYYLYTMILFWCALIVVSSVYVSTPLSHTFSMYFHILLSEAAWISSSFSMFYAIGFLFFTPFTNRIGEKQMIVFGLVMLTICTVSIGYSDNFQTLLVLRALQGFFAATFAPTALSYVFEVFPPSKRIMVIGYISFGYVLAGIIGQSLSDVINQTLDWHAVFYFFACIYGLSAILVAWLLPATSPSKKDGMMKKYIKQLSRIFRRKQLLYCYLITIMLLLTFLGMYTVLGDYLRSSPYHLTTQEVFYVRVLGVIGMLCSPFAVKAVKIIGELAMLRCSLAMASSGLLLLSLSNHLIVTILTSIWYVAGISFTFPIIMMIIGNLGGKERAAASSMYAFILFVGASLGPIISLKLLEIGGYILTFLILSCCLLIALGAGFLLKISRPKA